MEKCLLWVTGKEAKAPCGIEQQARGVEAGIEGVIHAMHVLWQEHSQEDDRGFFIIDERNAFNEEKQTAMFWDVYHEWQSGAQFTFNYYQHGSTLVVQNTGDGLGHFLQNK